MAKITKEKFKQACKGSGGIGTVVARAIGVTRQAIYHYLKRNPEMKEFLDEEGDKIIDVAEHNIDKEIVAGNIEISKWALINRKKGKARGYGLKQELEHTGVEPAVFIEHTKSKEEIKNGKRKKDK
jgi:DNA-binding XRE family transcriptional regulator